MEITVAAVQLWSTPERTPDENRQHAIEMAANAAESKPDLIVMPEAVAMLCRPDGRPEFSYRDVCEAIPGTTSEQICRIARDFHTNIVVGLVEDRGPSHPCQNTAVVIDRSGSIVGRYNKLHEPEVCRLEQDAGVGLDVPVFQLDFGTIGIMICWDLVSVELPALLAYKGAELICFPHLIGLPSSANFAIQLRARAIDAGVPIVAAGMRDNSTHTGFQDGICPTCIVDAEGRVVTQTDLSAADTIIAKLELSPDSPNARLARRRRTDLRHDVYSREYARLFEKHQSNS